MTSNQFVLNGVNYERDDLPKEGQDIVDLLKEAQVEINRIETQRQLLQAAQQQLINELKPILSEIDRLNANTGIVIIGQASQNIPTTATEIPDELPAPFPEQIPNSISRSNPTKKGFSELANQ